MATMLLSAAGAALGGYIGGTVAGISAVALGRAAGAAIGQSIDQRLLGAGSARIETGRIDRFRLSGASEGAPIGQVYGRMRVSGQVIWATRFMETSATTGGGKGMGPVSPEVTEYSYTVSMAVALCEGEITRVGRIWADGAEIATDNLNMRVYNGGDDQTPDPKIVAVEGAENTPAFRGTAYVVFEDLPLSQFGNRVPQLNFEVTRPSQVTDQPVAQDLSQAVSAVAMMPGSGEYTLATTPIYFDNGIGKTETANMHTSAGVADIEVALDSLVEELPKCQSTSLIVSWFGDDLRCGACTLKPKVEQSASDSAQMPWRVSGQTRATADLVPLVEDKPVYGGTPTDQSVIEAISALKSRGQATLFYPFILMDQLEGNTLENPWDGSAEQPALPWRGRITLSKAPNTGGSPDQSDEAEAQVAAFFGTASVTDFQADGDTVHYTGPAEWSYRRFILHYAHLCHLAGGVDAFCIGSEMRSLTQIRGAAGQFVAVEQLIALAQDVRTILGQETKISYAADWSEYFGYQPDDGTDDRYFNLDPLWADDAIDFVGIDNYMPLSDWRDGTAHVDADWGSIYNLDYLMGNVEGGEGYEWYYHSQEARDAQIRTEISDVTESEPWVFRYKDIKGWWSNPHYERVNGVRSLEETAWVPQSKPIWFTEIGCAAIDKGTNQPNKFLDPKSSESALPRYSNGRRDELMQMQYLRAVYSHWANEAHNPISQVYNAPMIDMDRAHVWAWDARPFPAFPDLKDVWSDAENYTHGHWLSGRTSAHPLESVVREICERSDVTSIDTSDLYGYVRGYSVDDVGSGRAALQPLMLAFGFDVVEKEGVLIFKNRTAQSAVGIDEQDFVIGPETETALQHTRLPQAELADRVRLNYVRSDGSFEVAAAEAVFPEYDTKDISVTDLNLALTSVEATQITERWLTESRVSRDTARFALPPSYHPIGAGDVVAIAEAGGVATFRIDRLEDTGARLIDAVRIEDAVYQSIDAQEVARRVAPYVAPSPVYPVFMDLPLLTGSETPHAPHVVITSDPWAGSAAVYTSATDSNYALGLLQTTPGVIGVTTTPLMRAQHGIIDHGPWLEIVLTQGALSSIPHDSLLAGANAAAIGDGTVNNWEVIQFQEAEITGENSFRLRKRLRGQVGTDALIPDLWPAGSHFVLLDGTPQQIDLAVNALNVTQHFRIGPAARPISDASYTYQTHAFQGNGLRPYAPVFLTSTQTTEGLDFSWVRRSRTDGAAWSEFDVPLGETQELYRVKIWQNGALLREDTVSQPTWRYSAQNMLTDGLTGPAVLQVAQLSETFGPGPFREIEFTA